MGEKRGEETAVFPLRERSPITFEKKCSLDA
jgi:hypothetical protein